MADGTLKVGTITTSSGSGTITLGQSGETISVPSGATFSATAGTMSGQNYPAFEAKKSTVQSLSNGSATKVEFNTEVFDTNSCYDNSTNYRFTPTVAGKYFVYLQLQLNATAANAIQEATALIFKNGSGVTANTTGNYANNSFNSVGSHTYSVIDFNGSSDYIEAYARIYGSGTLRVFSSGSENIFGAYRIGA